MSGKRGRPTPTRSLGEGSATAPGTTCGNHRANYPRHPGTSQGMVFAVQVHEPARRAGRNPCRIPPYKRGVTGSNPVAPTRFLQLDGLFKTLIGDPGNHSREPPVHAPSRGKGAQGTWQHSLRPPERAVCLRQAPPVLKRTRADGSASVSFADACLHRGEPDGWRASRGSPGDRMGGGRRRGRRSSVGRGAARGSGRRSHKDREVPTRAEAGADGRRGAGGVAGGPGG